MPGVASDKKNRQPKKASAIKAAIVDFLGLVLRETMQGFHRNAGRAKRTSIPMRTKAMILLRLSAIATAMADTIPTAKSKSVRIIENR